MEIKYQLEPADLEALNAFVHRGTPLGWAIRHLPLAGVAFVVVMFLTMFNPKDPIMTSLPAVVFAAFWAFFLVRRHTWLRNRATAVFEPATVILSPEAIEGHAVGRSSKTAWSQIKGYGETSSHVFIMLDAVSGLVVPKRALSPTDVAEVLRTVAEHSPRLPTRTAGSRWVFHLFMLWLTLLVLAALAWHFAMSHARH